MESFDEKKGATKMATAAAGKSGAAAAATSTTAAAGIGEPACTIVRAESIRNLMIFNAGKLLDLRCENSVRTGVESARSPHSPCGVRAD